MDLTLIIVQSVKLAIIEFIIQLHSNVNVRIQVIKIQVYLFALLAIIHVKIAIILLKIVVLNVMVNKIDFLKIIHVIVMKDL